MTAESTFAANETGSTAHSVHALMHFVRVVRYRQTVVLAALAVAALLGGLYYATAVRYYQAKASLLVLQTGADMTNTSMTPEGLRQGLMPTYEKLFSSAVVLEGAHQYLDPKSSDELTSLPREKWAAAIRDNLTTVTVRQTNILEIAYRARSPQASVDMVNALLRSYLAFMDQTHKGTAGDIITVLTKEKADLEQKLVGKEAQVLAARRRFGDLGIKPGGNIVHPMVQRAIGLNEALIKTQQKRLELQASLSAIQSAIRSGEDLQQHMLTLENAVGREFLLMGLGFSTRDAAVQTTLEKSMLEDQALLHTLREYYGPSHPKIIEVNDRSRVTEQYLATTQARVDQKLAQIRDNQLGPMLIRIVQQRLSETWQHENSLRTSFEEARASAVNMNGDLAQLEILEHDLKFLRDLRDVLLNQIASIDLKQNRGDIRTAVVSEPTLPKSPMGPRLLLIGLCSALGGIGAGLAIVYILDILDDRFRSPEELRSQLNTPVLAMIRKLDDLQAVGLEALQVHMSPDAVESEAFRTLRTTLAFSNQETSRMVVSSSEPGDGKTTVLGNLAVSFVQSGKKTLLIDADLRRPGLSNLMGKKGQNGLSDVLVSSDNVAEIAVQVIQNVGLEGLDFMPAGPRRPNPNELLANSRLADLLAWAETVYDQILIDSPPAMAGSDASIIGRLVDGVILVVQPEKNQRRLVMRAVESFTSMGVNMLGVVINRVGGDKNTTYGYGYGSGYGYGYGYGYSKDQDGEDDDHQDRDAEEAGEALTSNATAEQVSIEMERAEILSVPAPADEPKADADAPIVPRRVA